MHGPLGVYGAMGCMHWLSASPPVDGMFVGIFAIIIQIGQSQFVLVVTLWPPLTSHVFFCLLIRVGYRWRQPNHFIGLPTLVRGMIPSTIATPICLSLGPTLTGRMPSSVELMKLLPRPTLFPLPLLGSLKISLSIWRVVRTS